MTTIDINTAMLLSTAIESTFKKVFYACTDFMPSETCTLENTIELFNQFCEEEGVEVAQPPEDYVPDDVDETFYNPYMGFDDYEDFNEDY